MIGLIFSCSCLSLLTIHHNAAGDLLLVLFTIMASALLSASFALFLVRERETASKNVQMISGAPVSVFWLSTFLWDILNFSLPAAGDTTNARTFCGPLACCVLQLSVHLLAALTRVEGEALPA